MRFEPRAPRCVFHVGKNCKDKFVECKPWGLKTWGRISSGKHYRVTATSAAHEITAPKSKS